MFMKRINYQIKSIIHKNISITVKIKKNKYSRSYKVTYDKKNLQGLVSIPKYIDFKSGFKFAEENIGWIYSQHIEMFPPIIIAEGNTIQLYGKVRNFIFKEDKKNLVSIENNNIIVSSKNKLKFTSVFFNWIKEEIIKETKSIAIIHFNNKVINKIRISNSFSYWGACNTKDSISVDWRLIFAPREVMTYIIVHELCHLTEFNHSKKFWNLVDSKFANKEKGQLWLKENANYLYRIRFF